MLKKLKSSLVFICLISLLTGCVNQNQEVTSDQEITVAATSIAVTEILDQLNIPAKQVVGIPQSDSYTVPKKYQKTTKIGNAMTPDMEKISTLKPDLILSPNSLESDLSSKYEKIKISSSFLNLKNLSGMYKSIEELGKLFNKEKQAKKLVDEYDAVVLACGASNPRDINAPGRDANGIYFAVDFLKATTKSLLDSDLSDGKFISAKDKNVIVIGGGDTGNDCVGTCIRHGCKSVTQLEMMPKAPDTRRESNPWPQWPLVCKTDYGQEEAIAVFGHDPRIYTTTVKEFKKDKKGNLEKVVVISLESKVDEKTGRRMMVPVEGTEKELPCELVLIAAGFLGTQKYVTDAFGVELTERTNIKTEEGKFATNAAGVFTAGDCHTGQSLVVKAIRQGRDCAREVDKYLMGYTNL